MQSTLQWVQQGQCLSWATTKRLLQQRLLWGMQQCPALCSRNGKKITTVAAQALFLPPKTATKLSRRKESISGTDRQFAVAEKAFVQHIVCGNAKCNFV